MPTTTEISINCAYAGPNGEPRSLNQAVKLPLIIAGRLRPAAKSAVYKVTFETPNAEVQSLIELFSDFLASHKGIGIDAEDILGSS